MAGNKLVLFFLFGFLLSAACGDIADDLVKEIKEVKDKTKVVEAENRDLWTRIRSLPDEYKKKILSVTIEKYNVSAEIKEEWKIAHKLRHNITVINSEIKKTEHDLTESSKELAKFGYFIEWVSQLIVNFKLRRSKKEDQKCLDLYPLDNSTNGERSLLGGYKNSGSIHQLMRELNEAMYYYERALETNQELNATLTKDTLNWEAIYQSVVKELENAIKELKSVKELVTFLKEDSARTSKVLVDFKKRLDQVKDKVNDRRKEAQKIKEDYGHFFYDTFCYERLEQEILKKLP